MTIESQNRFEFNDRILPDLEVLLQFFLSLTRNGRDAVVLMREAIAEAGRSWDESVPEMSFKMWLRKILTRRSSDGFRQHRRLLVPTREANDVESLVDDGQYQSAMAIDARQKSFLTGEACEDVKFCEAIASLPAVFRSAMILSYLEGFSYTEMADLADAREPAIESWLNRGRAFLGEDFFTHLMGNDGLRAVAEGAAKSA